MSYKMVATLIKLAMIIVFTLIVPACKPPMHEPIMTITLWPMTVFIRMCYYIVDRYGSGWPICHWFRYWWENPLVLSGYIGGLLASSVWIWLVLTALEQVVLGIVQ